MGNSAKGMTTYFAGMPCGKKVGFELWRLISKMLTLSLPDYDIALNKMLNEAGNRFHMLNPVLRLFPPRVMMHGGTTRQLSSPRILDNVMRNYRATVNIDRSMFLQTDVDEFIDFFLNLITSLQGQQQADTLEVISDTSKVVGTYIEGKDRNIWDVYIEILERLELGFDDSGKPYSIGVPSTLEAKLTAVSPTEDQLEKARRIVQRKRQEYFSNKRNRRLSMTEPESQY